MGVHGNESDRNLALALLRDGKDAMAWLRLYRRMGGPIIRHSMDRGLSHAEAEEVLQETMITFHRELQAGKFDLERGSLGHWIMHLAKWKMVDQFRKRSPEDRHHADVEDEILTGHITPEFDLAGEIPPAPARTEELERALVSLQSLITPLEYAIFRELAFEHADGQTVADRHGLSRNAVYLHKRHALQKLEEILRPKP